MTDQLEQRRILGATILSTEETIRAYDLKAEVAMLCFVLSIEAIHVFVDFGRLKTNGPLVVVSLFGLFIAAMIGYMTVLLPIYKAKPADAESYSSTNVFFVDEPYRHTVDTYLRTLENVDLRDEMVHQIMMLSEIRNTKHRRFVRAIWITLAFFVVMLVTGFYTLVVS